MSASTNPEVAVLNAALELRAEERAAYLDKACAGDPDLRGRVEELLQAQEQAGDFLEAPAAGLDPAKSPRISVPLAEKPGDKIGHYKLLQQIGEGGCGVVYMAEQEEPVRRRVALKVIKLGMDTKSVIARFEAERQALALMDHPNIARVFDAGATATGRPYFVMELVRGVKITDFCDENKIPTQERLKLFIHVCQAIQHAHQKGIIHRDIKPSNILVTINDGVPVPKVIDFGIAKATQGRLTDQTLFTAFEQFLGTPAYMSPEQAVMTSLDIDTRSDIYSLGVLLYELLTGKTPFEQTELLAAGLDEMRRTIREKQPPKPSTRLGAMTGDELTTTASRRQLEPPRLIHTVRGDLDWIVMKALEKDRARRYETANGLAMDVQRYLNDEPIVARPPSKLYLIRKLIKRNKLAVAAATAVAAALIVGLGTSTWLFFREKTASQRAETASTEARATLAISDLLQATRLVADDNRGDALAFLVRILSYDPTNAAALTRLATLMEYHSWMVPTLTLTQSDSASSACFSPDGRLIATGSWNQSAQVWDAHSGLLLVTLMRHSDASRFPVLVNFSPEGQRLVTASADNTARIWNALTGQPLTQPLLHSAPVRCAQFSPDGNWIVTASQDGGARVWDVRSGQLVSGPMQHDGWVNSAQFSPDGRRIVTASNDSRARVWDAFTGALLCTLVGHTGWIEDAQFSPDGKRVVTASDDGTARIWDAQTGEPITPPSRHDQHVGSAQFSPDGKYFITRSSDSTARVWDAQTGLAIGEAMKHAKPIMSVQFSPDGKRILTASWDGSARIWDAQSGQPLTEPMKHRAALVAAQFSPDGKRVMTACYDDAVLLWEAQTRPALHQPLPQMSKVWSAQFSPNGKQIVTALEDHSAWLWDAQTGLPLGVMLKHDAAVRSANFSPDGRWLVTASVDRTARVWDAQTGKLLTGPLKHRGTVRSAQFSPDGTLVVTASEDSTARVWDARNGEPLTDPLKHGGWVYSAQFSPDSSRVVTASAADNAARVWDARTGRMLAECLGHSDLVHSAQFSPEGDKIVTASEDNTARVWDARSGRPLIGPLKHGHLVLMAQFSPDGKEIVTASADEKARVWDARSGLLIASLDHLASLKSAQFSLDGARIVTASLDGTARVWDARSGLPLTDPLRHSGEVWWAQFSPDGRRVLTVSKDQSAHIWDLAPVLPRCPDWLLPLAKAISGQVIKRSGVVGETELNRIETLNRIRQRLQREPDNDEWVVWGRWFLSDLESRAISPFSMTSYRNYLAAATENVTPDRKETVRSAVVARAAQGRESGQDAPDRRLRERNSLAGADGNLLVNGSFEVGGFAVGNRSMKLLPAATLSGGQIMSLFPGATNILGWLVVGPPDCDVTWMGPDTDTGCTAAEGSFFVDLTGFHDAMPYGGVSQTLPTIVGQRYALSFAIGSSALYDQTNLPCVAVEITGKPTTLHTVSEVGTNRWQTFNLIFTASAPSTTLTFTGANTNDLAHIGLDNVIVTKIANSSE